MTRAVSGYELRIGRYSGPLAERMAALVDLRPGDRALDVACGSGPLTRRLAAAVGVAHVAAIDSDARAAAACAAAVPGADVRVGSAEALPFADGAFDAVFAQLLVHLAGDAPGCAREMHRVARAGAPVATCVWDFAGGMVVLRAFWDAAHAAGAPGAGDHDQSGYAYATLPELTALWREAGLRDVEGGTLDVEAGYTGFDDVWDPLALPDGTPGQFLATLDGDVVARVREGLHERLGMPDGPFTLPARAWYVVGRASGRGG